LIRRRDGRVPTWDRAGKKKAAESLGSGPIFYIFTALHGITHQLANEVLETSRLALVIDTVPGNHRLHHKDPIARFPRLETYLADHYRPAATIEDHQRRTYYQVYQRLH